MVSVQFTAHLKRWFPDLVPQEIDAPDVASLVRELEGRFPGLAGYIVDERGSLRQHVNIFVNREMLQDREALGDPLSPGDEVHVFQALSGG